MHSASSNSQSVLVVDDDQIMRDVLALMLGAAGHEVSTAPSGEEALSMLASAQHHFSVVLTDMHMPGLQGAALAGRLEEAIHGSAALIGMSGSAPEPEAVRAFRVFLEKPFTTEEFESAVAQAAASGSASTGNPAKPATAAAVLDETIFARLAAIMPAAQLGELYRMTLDDVQRRLKLMRAAAKSEDISLCRAEAHSIKGGCGMVGAVELGAMAAAVEAGPLPGSAVFIEFDAACARLQSMLRARIA